MLNLTNEQKDRLISELDRLLDYFLIESIGGYYIIKGDFIPFLFYRVIKNKPLEDLSKITLIRNQHRLFFNLRNNQSMSGYNYGIKYDRYSKVITYDFFTNPYFVNLVNHDFIDFRFIIHSCSSQNSITYCTAIYLIDEEIGELNIHPCETIIDNLIYVIQNTYRLQIIEDKNGNLIEFFPTNVEHFTKLMSTQIWKKYSYSTEIPNAVIRKNTPYSTLSKYIPEGKQFKINMNDKSNDLQIHPFLLKKAQIKRLLDSFYHLGKSFTFVFWNEIIKKDVKFPKHFKKTILMTTKEEDIYYLFNILKSQKMDVSLAEIIKFFDKNANNPSIFWNFYLNFFKRNSPHFMVDLTLDDINVILHKSLLNFTQKANEVSETLKKYKIKILTKASELDLEGELMQHCIGEGNYDKYLNPNNIFFHIRTGWIIKRDSTVMLSYNPLTNKWWVKDHKGYKNDSPSKKHVAIVDKVINELNYIFLKGIQ